MKKLILSLFSLLILLSIFSCKNLFVEKNSGELKFALGPEVAEKISRDLLQTRGITPSTKLDVRCRVRVLESGNDSIFLEEIKPTSVNDLANVCFHLKELPLNTEFHIQVEILHKEIYLYGGASRPFTLTETEKNYKVNIPVRKRMSLITYDKNGGYFNNPQQPENLSNVTKEYFIYDPVKLPVPKKDGVSFQGWFLTPDLKGTALTTIGPEHFAGDTTLYAKWSKDDSTDFFPVKGGVYDINNEQLGKNYYPWFNPEAFPNIILTKYPYHLKVDNNNYTNSSNQWDYWLASKQNFTLAPNKNYKVSVDLKTDYPETCQMQFRDNTHSEFSHTEFAYVENHWKTFTFDSGAWTRESKAHLQLTLGSNKNLYIQNLIVQETTENIPPVDTWAPSGIRSNLTYEYIPNGVKFHFKEQGAFGKIGGQCIDPETFCKATFKISSDSDNIPASIYLHTLNDHFEVGGTSITIGTAPQEVTIYAPNSAREFRFANIEVTTPESEADISVTDFKVAPVTFGPVPGKTFGFYNGNIDKPIATNTNPGSLRFTMKLNPNEELHLRALMVDEVNPTWLDFTEFKDVVSTLQDQNTISIYASSEGNSKIIKNISTSPIDVNLTFDQAFRVLVSLESQP